MSQNPRDAVQFTRESAERIAGVVRTIELAAPKGRPLSFEAVQSPPASQKPFRIATFTAAWAKGTEQVLTFKNQTTTPNTVSATNLLYHVEPLKTTEPQICAIAREGTAWYFVNTDEGGGARKATFTGEWAKNAYKVVTLTADGMQVGAKNSVFHVPAPTGGTGAECVVTYDVKEQVWQLVNVKQGSGEVRKATFSGEWSKNESKTVDFAGGGTASVKNELYKIPSASGSRTCIVGQQGSDWYLLNESQQCSTGKDKDSLTTEEENLTRSTSGLKALISSGSGSQCMKWVELKKFTVITGVRFKDDGSGPLLECDICQIFAPAVELSPSDDFAAFGIGRKDVVVPVAGCAGGQ